MVVIRYHRVRRFVSIPEETTLKNEFNVLEEKKLAGQVEASSQSIVCGWRYVSLPTLSTLHHESQRDGEAYKRRTRRGRGARG